jgi:hypothetical protein
MKADKYQNILDKILLEEFYTYQNRSQEKRGTSKLSYYCHLVLSDNQPVFVFSFLGMDFFHLFRSFQKNVIN